MRLGIHWDTTTSNYPQLWLPWMVCKHPL